MNRDDPLRKDLRRMSNWAMSDLAFHRNWTKFSACHKALVWVFHRLRRRDFCAIAHCIFIISLWKVASLNSVSKSFCRDAEGVSLGASPGKIFRRALSVVGWSTRELCLGVTYCGTSVRKDSFEGPYKYLVVWAPVSRRRQTLAWGASRRAKACQPHVFNQLVR